MKQWHGFATFPNDRFAQWVKSSHFELPLNQWSCSIMLSSSPAPQLLNRCASLLLRQRCESQVWLDDLHLREHLVGLLALDARVHDHIIACSPDQHHLPVNPKTVSDIPGTQLIGVVTFCLSPVCKLSTHLNTSAVFRPVLAG